MSELKTKKAAKPFHEFIAFQIDNCGHRQSYIATRLGYKNQNIITMFKQGRTRVPIGKITELARIIGVDEARLMSMALAEYNPELLKSLNEFSFAVSKNEIAMIEEIRSATGHLDPKVDTKKKKEAFDSFISTLIATEEPAQNQ